MRIEQLTFTRFVAAILVIFFHHFRVNDLFINSYVFVSYFFVLSGFVLMVSQKQTFTTKTEYYNFYLKRFARIYPLFLFATLCYIVLTSYIGWDVLLHFSGVHAFFPAYALNYNYPGWSVSVELFFYLGFPFLVRFFYNKYDFKIILISVLAFWLLCQVIFFLLFNSNSFENETLMAPFLRYSPINHLNEFMAGNVLGLLYRKKHKAWTANYDLYILITAGCIFYYLQCIKPLLNVFDHNGLLILLFAPLILLLSLNTGVVTKVFKWKVLVLAGELSFGIYIMAEPMLLAIGKASVALSQPSLFYLYNSLIIIFVLVYFLTIFLERPLQVIIKRTATRYLLTKNI